MSYDPYKLLKHNVDAVLKWMGTLSLLHLKDERNWQDAISDRNIKDIIWCAEQADKIQAKLADRIVDLATELRIARAEIARLSEVGSK